jgi:hypothetical protein
MKGMSRTACALVCCTAIGVFAQNARIGAMGGVSTPIDDMVNILGAPADMNDYSDNIQATGTGSPSFGPYIAVKGVGSMLNLGFYGNGGSMLRSGFAANASSQFNGQLGTLITSLPAGLSGISIDTLPGSLPQYPHLLVGIDLDAVSIGVDLYGEGAKVDVEAEETVTGAASSSATLDGKAAVTNLGLLANVDLDLDFIGLSPKVGFSLPRLNADATLEQTGTTSSFTVESKTGVHLLAGTDLSLGIGSETDFVFGAYLTMENYQFETTVSSTTPPTTTTTTTESPEYKNTYIDGYASFATEALWDLLLAGQYTIALSTSKVNSEAVSGTAPTTTTTTTEYTTRQLAHTWALGLEKELAGVWVFDALIPRCGVTFSLSSSTPTVVSETKVDDNSTGTLTTTTTTYTLRDNNNPSGVNPTAGFGLRKGRFSFDINSQLGGWLGTVSGPPVVTGTLTLDFGTASSGITSSPAATTPSSSYGSYGTSTDTSSDSSTDPYTGGSTDTSTDTESETDSFGDADEEEDSGYDFDY